MRLLSRVPHSVLWLLARAPDEADNLRREAQKRGIDPERLVFAGYLPNADHLARLRLADLALDTLPYNAHTTGSDALWAGLPMLTCTGQTFASRVGTSLLLAVGLPELVTRSLSEYEDRAVHLATEKRELHALRQRLADNRNHCELFDTEGAARALEKAYVEMVDIERARRAARGCRD